MFTGQIILFKTIFNSKRECESVLGDRKCLSARGILNKNSKSCLSDFHCRNGSQMAKVWTIKIVVRLHDVYRNFSRIAPLLTIYHLNTRCILCIDTFKLYERDQVKYPQVLYWYITENSSYSYERVVYASIYSHLLTLPTFNRCYIPPPFTPSIYWFPISVFTTTIYNN